MLDVRQWLEALKTRVLMLLVRGLVNRSRYPKGEEEASEKGFTQLLQIRGLSGEVLGDVEYLEPYGFTSRVQQADPGAEHLAVSIAGDRARTVALVVRNRKFGIKVKPGEVALFDDTGQVVRLHQDGRLELKALASLRVNSPNLQVTVLNLTFNGTIIGDTVQDGSETTPTLQSIRDKFNTHTHPGSGPPQQQM
jgi:phage gp45-like